MKFFYYIIGFIIIVSVIAGLISLFQNLFLQGPPSGNSSESEIVFSTYTDPDGRFSVAVPEKWEIEEYEKDSRSKVSFTSSEAGGSITIIVEPFTEDTFVSEKQKERVRTEFKTKAKAQILSEKSIEIDGSEGWLMECKMPGFKIQAIAYVKNGYWHSITFIRPPSLSENDFDTKILESFRVLDGL